MVWRLAVSCSLAVLLAVQAPVRADCPQPVSPLPQAPAPARTGRDTALVVLLVGGVAALTAVFFGVRARRERNDPNPDSGLLDGAIASAALLIAVPTLGVGIGLMLPDDGGNRTPSSTYPRLAQLPQGLALRLKF